jgi:hypothetical protein
MHALGIKLILIMDLWGITPSDKYIFADENLKE